MLEKLTKSWKKAADNRQQDELRSRNRDIFRTRSFLGANRVGGLDMNECSGIPAELTRTIAEINDVALRSQHAKVGIASPAVLYVEKGTLVATPYGDWLRKTGWRGPVLSVLVATACLTYVGTDVFAEEVVMYEDQQKLTIRRRSSITFFLVLLFCLCLWFHLLQAVNRKMVFMLLRYFETIVIVGCQIGSMAAYEYNIRMTFGHADLYDMEWQVWNALLYIFAILPAALFIAVVDSLFVRKHHWNLFMVTFLFVGHSYSWLVERFHGRMWSAHQIVIFGREVGTARSWFCMNELQISMILGKMMTTYLMGYPWCVMRADFLRPHSLSAMMPDDSEPNVAPERDIEACAHVHVLAANEERVLAACGG